VGVASIVVQASDNLTSTAENAVPVLRASLVTTINESRDVIEQEMDAIARYKYQTSTSPFAKAWDPEIVRLMYPELYPYGLGGYGVKSRVIPISVEELFRNSLKTPSNKQQFATHPEYLMERADTFNKSEAIRSTCISLKYSNDDEAIDRITPTQVRNLSCHQFFVVNHITYPFCSC
jgi:hypothetical protein